VWGLAAHSEEEHRLRVLENRTLRKVFGPKREELKGQWIKLHREEVMLCTVHMFLGDQIKKNEMGGSYGTYGG
jgi:hypothetical protein